LDKVATKEILRFEALWLAHVKANKATILPDIESKKQITPEIETTLKLMKLRHVFNPKHFIKRDKSKTLPKYFQIGTVIDGPQDYYSEGVSKKRAKKKLVDDLLEDREFKDYHKSKFSQLQRENKRRGRKGPKQKFRKRR